MKMQFFKFPTKKTAQFLLFLPVIVTPFLTLIFWLMGGGGSSSLMAKPVSDIGLLTSLPSVDLSAQKNLNKLDSYEKNTADSIREKNLNQKSSFWDKNYFQTGNDEPSIDNGSDNFYDPDHQEMELHKKLDQLNKVLNSPENPQRYPVKENPEYKSKEIENVQKTLNSIGNVSDPELEQLNGMLEKIRYIQHPESHKDRRTVKELGNLYRAIPAVVDEKQKISQGSVVKLRLLESVELNHQLVPKGHLVFGICRVTNQRLYLDITSIRVGKSLLPVDLTTYDMRDGMEGINVPDALLADAVRTGSDDAVQGLQLLPIDQDMKTQIAGAGISAAKGLFSKRSRRIKVKLKDGYRVLLKNNSK